MLGIDLAGRVVRAGEDAPFSEGDEVFGRQQLGRMVRFMQYTMISFVFFPFCIGRQRAVERDMYIISVSLRIIFHYQE